MYFAPEDVTPKQRETIELVKNAFGEKGYVISSVAEEYRRSDYDFLAAEPHWPRKFVIVRPTKGGQVSIVGFNKPSHYIQTRKHLDLIRHHFSTRVVWSHKQLRYEKENTDWWKAYFPPNTLEPLGLPGL